jgi:hypothetical protein
VKSEAGVEAEAEVGEAGTRERQGRAVAVLNRREDISTCQKNKGREMTHRNSDSKSGGCRPSFVIPVVFFTARPHHASSFSCLSS